jgi:hypothetical protein
VVGGRVLAGSLDGKLYVLDLAKDSEIMHFELVGAVPKRDQADRVEKNRPRG